MKLSDMNLSEEEKRVVRGLKKGTTMTDEEICEFILADRQICAEFGRQYIHES